MASGLLARSPQSSRGAISHIQNGQHASESGARSTTAHHGLRCPALGSQTTPSDVGDQTTAAPTNSCDAHASVGLSSVSVSTVVDQDGYPRLNVIVDLEDGDKEAFRARLDTGCDLNLMPEEVARRLTELDNLPDSDLEEPIATLSTSPVRAVKRMKLTFSINGLTKPFKAWFYVVPDDCVHEAFDALLGEKFIVATGILQIIKELKAVNQ